MRVALSKVFLLLFLSLSFSAVFGQGVRDLRINEVLVKNDSNCIDQYGVRSGWFEVFNTGYAMADIGGCYVTNDINNPKKYRIPKGDPRTRIASRTYALFYAYSSTDRGIFHVNFSLDEVGFLALYDQSGTELLDSVSYDISAQTPDVSFGKMENIPVDKAQWEILAEPTPDAINYTTVDKTRAEKYAETDPYGGIITLTTMTIVFIMLILLALIFTGTRRFFQRREDKEKAAAQAKQEVEITPAVASVSQTGDSDIIAIATALYLYFDDQHEVEQTGFWLKRQMNEQSAWGAKNLLFKKSPDKK
jgi:sodium pump decarboxylase gamma subunit